MIAHSIVFTALASPSRTTFATDKPEAHTTRMDILL